MSWRIDGPGKRSEWIDGHGNQVTTFSVAHRHDSVEIAVHGIYEYSGADQWLRYAETPTLAGAVLAAQHRAWRATMRASTR